MNRAASKEDTLHWTYDGKNGYIGQTKWYTLKNSQCGGKRQSPIDIQTNKLVLMKSLEIEYKGYYKPLRNPYVENNGHTVQLMSSDKKNLPMITGSALDNQVYKFVQAHFHWGVRNGFGSEHKINGRAFALELHLVHVNTKYKTLEEALGNPDGLAVLAVLYKVSRKINPYIRPLMRNTAKVTYSLERKAIREPIVLRNLLPPKPKPFMKYYGSLTTPPCSEVVTWIVFRDIASIGIKQENVFRQKRGEVIDEKTGKFKRIGNNFRTVNDLNGRKVYISSS
ncbi:Carbonic anhydrase 7-like protein [Dinothrombium tinctorium]|uniref:Carbonic anhydrase n=1 Tax=Dinothrombium tinctorium TaxID=1965070 RepID=A0A3S3NNJ6_9ACAR|nr:Carbonic anhydrase 7-like protein [Dinothrombium tinctorium]RWS06213.1 Carbonic anhydrase 7-like protein [Dinothrombium tinctorium]RWS06214.1 Carbonic anhydrase 7-like protein [Dinothrombium tinctorium]